MTSQLQRFLCSTAILSILIAGAFLFVRLQKSQDLRTKEPSQEKVENEATGVNDFDFLIGSWRVHHCRLKERLAGNHEGIEFEGTCAMQESLGGAGNMDENILDFPGGAYRAVTLRTYDATKKQWSIWWIEWRDPRHLDPPVVGGHTR